MRNIVTTLFLFVIGISAYAQKAGESYIGGAIAGSMGWEFQESTFKSGPVSKNDFPTNRTLVGALEIGTFTSDNFRVSVTVGVGSTWTPYGSGSDGKWEFNNNGLNYQVGPSAAYYFKLAENFYYTPEVGALYAIVNESGYKFTGWIFGANFLAFEYRISQKVSLCVELGSITFSDLTTTYTPITFGTSSVETTLIDRQLRATLNDATFVMKFYF